MRVSSHIPLGGGPGVEPGHASSGMPWCPTKRSIGGGQGERERESGLGVSA